MTWFERLRNVFRSDEVSDEIEREMAFHLSERVDELVAAGMHPDAARREALRRFGNPMLRKEETRDRDLLVWLDTLAADVRYALRTLRAKPGFALVAILSLALGIGANTAVFTLIDALLLRSLPVRHPEELVLITRHTPGDGGEDFSNTLWDQIREHVDLFDGVFIYGPRRGVNLGAGGEARPVAVGLVSGDFFSTLGVRTAVGRPLTGSDDQRGCAGTVVLTHAFWQGEYGGANVVGRSIALDGNTFQIVGVAEPGFAGVEPGHDVPLWAPRCAAALLGGAARSIIGRPKPGVALPQIRARLDAIRTTILEAALPANMSPQTAEQYRRTTFDVVPFSKGFPFVRNRYGEALWILMAAVGVVLLISCGNLANLLLARASARQREIAVRLALGARRSRLIRQLLTESLVLSLAGAAAGVLFARWGSRMLVGLLSSARQVLSLDLSPDPRILAFTMAIGVLTGVLFGLAPALRAARVDPHAAIKSGGRGLAEGHSRLGAGKTLVAAQIALSLVALVAAGLLIGSWRRLGSVDPGFRSDGVLLVGVNFRPARIPRDRWQTVYRRILERLRATPGVRAASATWRAPLAAIRWNAVIDAEGSAPPSADAARAQLNEVSEGYFATMGTPMLAGRDFDGRDTPASPKVAIVSEELARRFFGGAAAIGRLFRIRPLPGGEGLQPPIEIVGIVADTKQSTLDEASQPIVYFALGQNPTSSAALSFALRAASAPAAPVPAVKRAIWEIDPRLTLEITTLERQLEESVRLHRTLGVLSGFFGALALLLAAIGLYGLMAYGVARRRNEIGVRIALGAARTRILSMVLADVGRVVAAGVAAGALLSLALTRLVSRFLYGVEPNDPATLVVSALTLVAVAIGAAVTPAWRAASLDPVTALRQE